MKSWCISLIAALRIIDILLGKSTGSEHITYLNIRHLGSAGYVISWYSSSSLDFDSTFG